MRVVILGTRGFPNVQGGVEKHCEGLAIRLVKLGCEVTVFTRKPYVNTKLKEYKRVKLVALPAIRYKAMEAFIHTFIGVFAALRYKPDILHIQAIGPALFTPLARILGMKVVVTSHGSNYKHLKWGFCARIALKLAEFLAIFFANEVIAISETIAGEIKEKYNRTANVISNGIDIPKILNSENSLKKYALIKGRYVLTIGRFVPVKGFDLLIDAFNQAGLKDWKLVIIGTADHKTEYRQELIRQAQNNPDVILTGYLNGEPLKELYSHAGLFVLPSYYEGLPIGLLEAISYGLLCIASDIPANRHIGLPVENYFIAGNIEELTQKLKEFSQKVLSKEKKLRQIEMLRKRYSWDEVSKKTSEVYKKVVVK